jgi:hypothetical protein
MKEEILSRKLAELARSKSDLFERRNKINDLALIDI